MLRDRRQAPVTRDPSCPSRAHVRPRFKRDRPVKRPGVFVSAHLAGLRSPRQSHTIAAPCDNCESGSPRSIPPSATSTAISTTIVAWHRKGPRRRPWMLLAFPEMVITGYPPGGPAPEAPFIERAIERTRELLPLTRGMTVVVGTVDRDFDLYNAAAVLHDGQWVGTYRKRYLPNYGVFDENRYFMPGTRNPVFVRGDTVIGINICEDIWYPGGPVEEQVIRGGAEIIVNLSASPYHAGKAQARRRMLCTRASDNLAVVCYVNLVGRPGRDRVRRRQPDRGRAGPGGGRGRDVRRGPGGGGPRPGIGVQRAPARSAAAQRARARPRRGVAAHRSAADRPVGRAGGSGRRRGGRDRGEAGTRTPPGGAEARPGARDLRRAGARDA